MRAGSPVPPGRSPPPHPVGRSSTPRAAWPPPGPHPATTSLALEEGPGFASMKPKGRGASNASRRPAVAPDNSSRSLPSEALAAHATNLPLPPRNSLAYSSNTAAVQRLQQAAAQPTPPPPERHPGRSSAGRSPPPHAGQSRARTQSLGDSPSSSPAIIPPHGRGPRQQAPPSEVGSAGQHVTKDAGHDADLNHKLHELERQV